MKQKKALMTASVASMIDLFNMDNIRILRELGYEVHVAANFAFGSITSQERVDNFKKELEEAGIKVYHVPIPRSIAAIKHIFLSYRQMKQLMETEEYEIVHTQSPIGGVVARIAAKKVRKKGTRVIYTAHGFHFFDGAKKINWMVFYPIEKILSKYTDVLITINKEDYNRGKTFHAKKVCYVPGIGVDTDKFRKQKKNRTEMRKVFGFSDKDFVLMSVGQLSKRKNQETVIHAMAHVEDESIKYLLVGLGEMEANDRKLIKKYGLEKRVILAGYKDNVEELLHMADGFIFPSLQEGLPVSLMEAMAAGLPVIASRIRGNTDLVTDGMEGILVEKMDINSYAKAICKIKTEAEFRNMLGINAQKKMQRFCIKHVQSKMQKIYENV